MAGICGLDVLMGQSNIEVTGMGFFKNRSLDGRLAFLHDMDANEPAALDTPLLEDSAFLLIEQVKREGYLKPVIEGRFTRVGAEETVRWEEDYSIQLDVGFTAEHAVFEIIPGQLYYYKSVEVEGVPALREKVLGRYFIPGGVLFRGKSSRVFTYENLDRRTGRLVRALAEMGYRGAKVEAVDLDIDDTNGAVRVSVRIQQGALHRVGEVRQRLHTVGEATKEKVIPSERVALTRDWEQARLREIRNEAYAAGYPDVRIRMETVAERSSEDGALIRDLLFDVERGERVTLEDIVFSGDEGTARSVLRRQADLDRGEPLNLLEVSEARRKLMGLGIYREVDLDFEPSSGERRKVVYGLIPNQRKELRLLAGWGSYEQARVGLNWEHRNPWGQAHRYELGMKQSLKSTDAEATYSIPQFLGTDLTLYSNFDYREREEISFDRSTRSIAVGTSTYFSNPGIRMAVEYRFSLEEADRKDDSDFETEDRAIVGSVKILTAMDRRDNALVPTAGYNLFASYEVASTYLGGNVDFHRMETGGSLHFSITESTIIHARLRYGAIFSDGAGEDNIPFNKRFFWGGENSVRGYREGGASPLDSNGDEVGAEYYLLGNLELEQRIWNQLSVIAFVDGVANGQERAFDQGEPLYSAGMGFRYNTAVGPIRLEYGHNLNPRESDPDGTFHFSIGYPF